MKTKVKYLNAAALAATLILGGASVIQADEEDASTNTIAYWKFGGTSPVVESISGVGISDLATNVGQGMSNGTASTFGILSSVDNLTAIGPVVTFPNDVPPSGMFNTGFNAGIASWDAGVDLPNNAEVYADPTVSGNEWIPPSFTEEIIFKTDTANDPTLGTVKQTLLWNHQTSAYAHLQLNESANWNPDDVGSLLFWGWYGDWPAIRITAAQNGGHRFDDGQWHYAACRFNHDTLMMDIFVVNQDGTTAESSSRLVAPLNPGNPAGGNFIIGNDEGAGTPFMGKINQVRFSKTSLAADKLLAKVTSCSAPVFASTPVTNSVAVGGVVNYSPVNWPAQIIQGGPLQFQWQLNGANVAGQTNLALNLFPVLQATAGTYQLIVSTPCGGISATSAPVTVQVSPTIQLARWGFNFTEASTFPQATVDDLAPNYLNVYDLITFNAAPNISGIGGNGEIPLTNSVPPATMFINGNNGGTNAFDPSYLAGYDGVVFYPNNLGQVFDFQGSFSLELFFRTYGDQSSAGTMELVCQGTDGGNTFRYGININQAGPGALSFGINNFAVPPTGPAYEDTNPGIQSVVLNNANYADGNWHYMLAQYDAVGNKIIMSVANADNSGTNASVVLPVGYGPLPSYNEGNLFVSRMRYPLGEDNRNFFGAIDEVTVSAGLVTPSFGQLGYLPVPPNITGITVSGGTVTIIFTGAPTAAASSYSVVSSSTIKGTYSAVSATVASLGGGNFQATLLTSGSAEFYRIKH